MSFTAFTNIITILFCIAVLVQSVRMMRSLKQVREGQLDRTVGALDIATASARSVLAELKQTLSTEGAANARTLNEAREVREELNVMIGIANAMAERLIEAASAGSRQEAALVSEPEKPTKAPRKAPSRSAKTQQAKADAPAPAKAKRTKAAATPRSRAKRAASSKTAGTASHEPYELSEKEMA